MRVLVYGSRPDGHANVVTELAAEDAELELVGLVDDYPANLERTVQGLKVLGTGDDLEQLRDRADVAGLILGFGESRGRAEIVERTLAGGLALPALVHRTAYVCESAQLGDGAQVLALAYVGPDAKVGAGVLVNTGAIVEHNATLADGAVVSPGATICGRVHVGRDATVGAGATILPDVTIGARATVGAGALVREDVSEGTLVGGVPARELTERAR
jgi:sugar O-acyltransferase (sialic acid O-acetyltransferase NeuD family)